VLPGHAQTFLQELGTRPAEPATLTWAVQQLRDLSRRSTELKWDERLGILGVSAGIEYMFYWLTGLLFSMPIWTLTRLPLELRPLPGLAFDVVLLAVLGFWLRGGPVFHFLGIEVRRVDGSPASRWRCAWRNVVTWLPLIFFNAFVPMFMFSDTIEPQAGAMSPVFALLMLLTSCGGGCLQFLALGGVIYSVVRPRRGIQDLLAGTCLVPR
jgi:hypothetical protein